MRRKRFFGLPQNNSNPNMNSYELTFILKPSLSDKKRDDFILGVKKWVEDMKGKVEKSDVKGKNLLAYPIKNYSEGIYVFMELKLSPKEVKELDRRLRLEETVLRYLLIKSEELRAKS